MKKKTFLSRQLILCMMSVFILTFSGCQKTEEEGKDAIVFPHSYFLLAEHLMDNLRTGVQTIGRDWEPVPDSAFWAKATAWSRTPKDSIWHIEKDTRFYFVFTSKIDCDLFIVERGTEEHKRIDSLCVELRKNLDSYVKSNHYTFLPQFFFAGIDEGARITADKKLFGRDAGSNLGDLLMLEIPSSANIGLSYPDYSVYKDYSANESSISFSDFFQNGTALSLINEFYAYFAEQPSEECDEVTFTIEIPIECEHMRQIIFGDDYPEIYYKQGMAKRNDNRVLRGSVTIKFDE